MQLGRGLRFGREALLSPSNQIRDVPVRYLRQKIDSSFELKPRTGYFPPFESPNLNQGPPSALAYRRIEVFIRQDRRAILRRVRRASEWIPGFLQGRSKTPDILLRVPLKPISEDYQSGLYALQKRGKVRMCGPLYELVIRADPDGLADVAAPEEPVRVQPMGMLVHPITDEPVGLNMVYRPPNEPVRVRIPVRYLNEEKCLGLKSGGWINGLHDYVDINVAPGVRAPLFATQDLAGVPLHGKRTVDQLEFEGKGEGCRAVLDGGVVSTVISKC